VLNRYVPVVRHIGGFRWLHRCVQGM
jgi:hypothetical protein